jgi:hypothetical protein
VKPVCSENSNLICGSVVALIDELDDAHAKLKGFQADFWALCERFIDRIDAESWFETDRKTRRLLPKVEDSVYMYKPTVKGE